MYNIFGSKWLTLHEGPMLSTVSIGQQHTLAVRGVTDPLKVHCIVYKHLSINITIHMLHCPKASTNIPGVSSRTIWRLNNDSGFTKDATIQVYQLMQTVWNMFKVNFCFFNWRWRLWFMLYTNPQMQDSGLRLIHVTWLQACSNLYVGNGVVMLTSMMEKLQSYISCTSLIRSSVSALVPNSTSCESTSSGNERYHIISSRIHINWWVLNFKW